ncbi:MAG: GatB/YqeY domain-containing protein, partial [Bdellovibrionales bacterium]|nr:GatB/YqeY domain-containing protein [Bdellovibrionales bacterium]NQZ17712.1 GatB/YqeY domain-containing protein [Bdellovibrionales bacterium]
MSLKEQILADIKDAMKAKEADKVSTLRMVNSSIKNKEIEVRPNELTEQDVLSVLKKLSKQRKDSIEQFQKAGRDDLVQQEQKELQIIEGYLPEQMGEDQVKAIVQEVINETGASSMKDMGKVMQAVLAKTDGAADNKLVS